MFMNEQSVSIDGIEINVLALGQLRRDVRAALEAGIDRTYVGFYASLLLQARIDQQYYKDLANADRVYPDGKAIEWYCRVAGRSGPVERLATTDIWPTIAGIAVEYARPVVVIGSSEEANAAFCAELESAGCEVSYRQNGYWSADEESAVIEKVRGVPGAVVFVGLGSGVQERFVRDALRIPCEAGQLFFTVGGLYDHVAGSFRRAPAIVQRTGLEWAWRTAQEPKRLAGRYIKGNSYFVFRAIANLAGLLKVREVVS
jgi:N-acetylglucosaminyldiphosphoundecaprenol N-acetyl-beta-D-mannosaminyltransferase